MSLPEVSRTHTSPVVLLATEQPIYAANFLQALAAVPQLRDIFTHIEVEQDGRELRR